MQRKRTKMKEIYFKRAQNSQLPKRKGSEERESQNA
jgi:hypothetical protein